MSLNIVEEVPHFLGYFVTCNVFRDNLHEFVIKPEVI